MGSFYRRRPSLFCSGPCDRVAIDLAHYSVDSLRKFNATGLCVMCGDGATYLCGLKSDKRIYRSRAPIMSNLKSIPPLRVQLQRQGWNKTHPELYKAVTGGLKVKKTKKYLLQKAPVLLLDSCYRENTADIPMVEVPEVPQVGGDEEFEPDYVLSEDDEEDVEPGEQTNEPAELGTGDNPFAKAAVDEQKMITLKYYEAMPVEDAVPEEEVEVERSESNPKKRRRVEDEELRKEGFGVCCVCDGDCHVLSQSCGTCARSARRALDWSKLGDVDWNSKFTGL
jgi:hypothetical protein